MPKRARKIDLLVGYYHKSLTLPEEIVQTKKTSSGPAAIKTQIGWVLFQPVATNLSKLEGSDGGSALAKAAHLAKEAQDDQDLKEVCDR